MKQYEFHDLDVNTRGDPSWLPPEALYIRYPNGTAQPIEDLIDGYQTLTVTGRELLPYTVNSAEVSGMDGTVFREANYPSREIVVKYQLLSKDEIEFRAKFERLNYLLKNKEFNFYFYDDPLFEYQGTVSASDTPDAGKLNVVSTFTITCSSPFKRLIHPTVYNFTDSCLFTEPIYWATDPDSIEITMKQATTNIVISNGTQTIKVVGSFKAGDKLLFTFGDNSDIQLNGQSNWGMLDLLSDYENFTLERGETLNVSPPSSVILKIRRKSL